MSQVLKVIDGSREVYRFEGDMSNFKMDSFKRWLRSHKFGTPRKSLIKWCIASFMYGMAIRVYLA